MRRRTLSTLTATAVLLVSTALPASAHARLEQKQIPASAEADLSMRVPGEREGFTNDAVEIQVPAEFTDVTCATVAGWTCETSASGSGTVMVWERAEDGDPEASLAFRATAPDATGTYRLPTIQVYSDGTEVAWIQTEDGADRPAPSLTVAEADAAVEQDTAAPETDHDDPAAGADEDAAAEAEATPAEEQPAEDVSETEEAADAEDDADPVTAEDAVAETDGSGPILPAILAVVALGGVIAVFVRKRQAG